MSSDTCGLQFYAGVVALSFRVGVNNPPHLLLHHATQKLTNIAGIQLVGLLLIFYVSNDFHSTCLDCAGH